MVMDCAEQTFIQGTASKCWIRLLIFSVGLFGITQLRAATGSDNAANYSLWSSGSNEGTGFGPWSFESNDNGTDALAGFYLADPTNPGNRNSGIFSPDSSGKAFALSVNPSGTNPSDTYMAAKRFFGGANAAPLAVGESFTFKWLQYWGGGYKGINLYRGGWDDANDRILNLRQNGDPFVAQRRGSTNSPTAISNAFNDVTMVQLRLAAPDTLVLTVKTSDPADEPYTDTFRAPAPDRVSFYFGNPSNPSNDQPLFNDLTITQDEVPVATRHVKFSVNMAVLEAQSPKKFHPENGDKVFVRGYPSGGWGDTAKVQLIEDENGIYSATVLVPGDLGLKSGGYKFYIQKGDGSSTTLENGGFEDGLDREFDLIANNTDLPVVYFSNIRSFVTFAVDMNVQKSKGTFNPTSGQAVELKGSFNDWGAGIAMGDLDGDGIYTVTLPIQGNSGGSINYKFRITGAATDGSEWETVPTSSGNRSLILGGTADIVKPVTFSNVGTTFAVWSGEAVLTPENLAKYAIGGATSLTATDGQASVVGLDANTLKLTAIVRDDPSLIFVGEAVTGLADFSTPSSITPAVVEDAANQPIPPPTNCIRKVFSVSRGTDDSKFLRIKVTKQ
jgi:hypothetical protein